MKNNARWQHILFFSKSKHSQGRFLNPLPNCFLPIYYNKIWVNCRSLYINIYSFSRTTDLSNKTKEDIIMELESRYCLGRPITCWVTLSSRIVSSWRVPTSTAALNKILPHKWRPCYRPTSHSMTCSFTAFLHCCYIIPVYILQILSLWVYLQFKPI